MNIEELLLNVARQAVDTLPDYSAEGLSDDELCDVAWVKGRLVDAVALAEAECQGDREAA